MLNIFFSFFCLVFKKKLRNCWGRLSVNLKRYLSVQPMEVYVDDEAKLTLHGLQQHYVKLKENEKNKKLFELLDVLEFNQVVIFVKSVQRCMALATLLTDQNFPAIGIHRGMTQEERLSRYQQFKDFQKVNFRFFFSKQFGVNLENFKKSMNFCFKSMDQGV